MWLAKIGLKEEMGRMLDALALKPVSMAAL